MFASIYNYVRSIYLKLYPLIINAVKVKNSCNGNIDINIKDIKSNTDIESGIHYRSGIRNSNSAIRYPLTTWIVESLQRNPQIDMN